MRFKSTDKLSPLLRSREAEPLALRPLLALSLAGAVLLASGCRRESASEVGPPPSPTNEITLTTKQMAEMKIVSEVADEQNVDDTILTSGRIAFDDQRVVHVFSPVTGKVTKVAVELGQRVKKGDLLARIESPEIGVVSSDVGKAKAELVAAEHELRRQKELFAAHATPRRELERAEDNYGKAKAEMDRASQKARLLRTAHVDLVSQTYALRADIDGEVFMKAVSPGMEIAGQWDGDGNELFTIGEADPVWVIADVFEMDIARVKVGSKVNVSVVSAPNRVFEGTVDWVSSILDKETHAAKVRCKFDNADRALKPGMYATVQISVDEKRALAIPRSAVLRLRDQTIVFVDHGPTADGEHRFERLPVTVDEGEGGTWLTVSHGLERGQRIVTSGAILLTGML